MIKSGFFVNILGILTVSFFNFFWFSYLFQLDSDEFLKWSNYPKECSWKMLKYYYFLPKNDKMFFLIICWNSESTSNKFSEHDLFCYFKSFASGFFQSLWSFYANINLYPSSVLMSNISLESWVIRENRKLLKNAEWKRLVYDSDRTL